MPETITTFSPPRHLPALARLGLATMPQAGPRLVSFRGINPGTPGQTSPAASSAPGAHDVLEAPNPAASGVRSFDAGGSANPAYESGKLSTMAQTLRLGAILTGVVVLAAGAFAVLGSRKKKRKGRRG